MKEKDAIYMKPDFSDEDGVRAAELEGEFAELGGWEAESEASQLLQNLNIPENLACVRGNRRTIPACWLAVGLHSELL